MSRRVVVTGLGAVSGFGVGIDALWSGLAEGRCALGRLSRFDASCFVGGGLAAEAVGADGGPFSARDFVPKHYRKAVKVMARDTEIAVAAAKLAVEHARLKTLATADEPGGEGGTSYPARRMGCSIGAGLIAADAGELAQALSASPDGEGGVSMEAWGSGGMENLTPLWLLKYLPNMLACHVTILHGAEGPSNTITCAHASGLLSIGESTRIIERGGADMCFAGSAESRLTPLGYLRMSYAHRLADGSGLGSGAGLVRPFGPDAAGTVMGEGGGILILEELEAALARGATPVAEVIGFGSAQSDPDFGGAWAAACGQADDGPSESGMAEADEGYRYAVEAALSDAEVGPERIDAAVVLGSGVAREDRAERAALEASLGARAHDIPWVTLTQGVGDPVAGWGGLAAAVGACCVQRGTVPAGAVNRRVGGGARGGAMDGVERVLVCGPSLGGQNAAVVLRAFRSSSPTNNL